MAAQCPALCPSTAAQPPRENLDCVIHARGKRREAVLELIRSARESLALTLFRCDDYAVLDELGAAAARGVKVEVLMTGRAKGWSKRLTSLARLLERMGIQVHRVAASGVKYHAKYMVADTHTALITSMNLTRKCFRGTCDFAVATRDLGVIRNLRAHFERDRTGNFKASPARSRRLIFAPGDARERIEALLRGARQTIRIVDHKLSDVRVLGILRTQRAKGVQVEIAGGELAKGLKPHGKMILVDGAVAILGSIALTPQGMDSRRELAIVVENPAQVAALEKYFARLTPPVAATMLVAA